MSYLKWIGMVLGVIVIVGGGIYLWQKSQATDATSETASTLQSTAQSTASSSKKSTGLIKHLGVEIGPYDPTTKKAGAFSFPTAKLGEFDRPFFEYGFRVPANSAGPAKSNPQPTFVVPLGTPVYSIVDGTVVDVPTLYSNDYSIHVQAKGSDFIFEMEHVINPLVKKGDKVTAGQQVATVSDYDAKNTPGFGLVEIGILQGGNPPQHVCPFVYLDDTIKAELQQHILGLYKAWEEHRGDTAIFDEATQQANVGCLSLDPIEG